MYKYVYVCIRVCVYISYRSTCFPTLSSGAAGMSVGDAAYSVFQAIVATLPEFRPLFVQCTSPAAAGAAAFAAADAADFVDGVGFIVGGVSALGVDGGGGGGGGGGDVGSVNETWISPFVSGRMFPTQSWNMQVAPISLYADDWLADAVRVFLSGLSPAVGPCCCYRRGCCREFVFALMFVFVLCWFLCVCACVRVWCVWCVCAFVWDRGTGRHADGRTDRQGTHHVGRRTDGLVDRQAGRHRKRDSPSRAATADRTCA
jgi:hypothetical protein